MGSGVCSADSSTSNSNTQQNSQSFLNSIKYYYSQVDPISQQNTEVYSYKQIFLHKKVYQIETREHFELLANFMLLCARCPTGVQQIVQVSSAKNYSPKCSNNYSVCVFAQHLNFSLAQHLQNLRFKNQYLRSRQILYLLKQLVTGAEYLTKKNLFVKSFDSTAIYLSSTYEIRIPYTNIGSNQWQESILGSSNFNQVLCVAPQQIDSAFSSLQIREFTKRTPQISRVFSLGMLILQCATMLNSIVTYYNYSHKKIDLQKLNGDIKALKDGTLAALLSRMLQADPRKRIKLKELGYIINKFEQSMFEKYLTIY